MEDGLYRVTTPYLCAGFTVKQNKLYSCAPILKRKIEYWKTIATHIKPMRPYELLPFPLPSEYDPAINNPDYFYQNFVQHFIPDMIQMMTTGLKVDADAVEELRNTIDNVLVEVTKTLEDNPLIQQYQKQELPAAQKAWEKEATKAVRTPDYYLQNFDSKNMVHRTWVVNAYLKAYYASQYVKDKWTIAELKKLAEKLGNTFLIDIVLKTVSPRNSFIVAQMEKLAEYKAELWNKPRVEKAKQKVVLPPFNPNSTLQMRKFFEMLNIDPLERSAKTGEPSWGREQLEELQQQETDEDLQKVLQAFIDFSYSAIIKNNFLKAFDAFTIDGVLHGNVKVFGAKSFRNTSNSPNLFNAPSTGSIYAKPLKRCFIAPKNMVVYTADLNGLEDRVIANVSGDTNKQAVFLENLDGHSLAATYYFKERVAELIGPYTDHKSASKLLSSLVELKNSIAKEIRQDGKPISFGLAYGAYPPKLRKALKCSIQIATDIFNSYHHELYPGITDYRENYVLENAKTLGHIHLGLGCRIYTDNAEQDIRTLANATVQFWSILTLIAINELNHRIREEKLTKEIQVTSTIYDSIYTQAIADADVLAWLNNNMIEVMTVQYLQEEVVRNEAEGEIGLNWADLHAIPNHATPSEIQQVLDEIYKSST